MFFVQDYAVKTETSAETPLSLQSHLIASKWLTGREDEQLGRPPEESGAARPVVPAEPPDHALQTSTVAVPAFLCLETLPSTKPSH